MEGQSVHSIQLIGDVFIATFFQVVNIPLSKICVEGIPEAISVVCELCYYISISLNYASHGITFEHSKVSCRIGASLWINLKIREVPQNIVALGSRVLVLGVILNTDLLSA